MSGIAGIIRFDGAPVDPMSVEKITTDMAHRGPDSIRHWRKGSVALGHCMLRTTPESLEEIQPLINEDKSLVLVMDGRLDNRDELRRELLKRGMALRTNTDAELVLRAYQLWGEQSPQYLLGDFAYAVWDARKQQLFCARDHVGARPFYYARYDRFFAFASEEEALLRVPGVSNQPNEELIAHLLVPAFRCFDSSRSWLQDIWALMPAQSLTVSGAGEFRAETYWRLEPGEENIYGTDEECREAFLDLFGEAVRCRMRSLGNVSAMMSGGLDSAGIAAMVKRLLPEMPGKEFHTYSAISDHPESCVESQCVQSLTKDLGTNAHFVSVPSFQGMVGVEDLIEAAWQNAHPVDNTILLPAMMCLAANRQGGRVILHGASGDLTMHVPHWYAAYLMQHGQWARAWGECQGASRNNTYLRGLSPIRLFLRNAWAGYMPGRIKILTRQLREKGESLADSVINPEFARRIDLKDRLRLQETAEAQLRIGNLREAHSQVLSDPVFGIVLGLMGYEHMAGRYSVELRDPWADKRVLEFFVRLPLNYKIRDGWTKYLMRTAFASELEFSVKWRLGKEHLGWRFAGRFMEEARELVSHTMDQGLGILKGYVDLNAVRERHEQYKNLGGDAEREFVYSIITLILWMQKISE